MAAAATILVRSAEGELSFAAPSISKLTRFSQDVDDEPDTPAPAAQPISGPNDDPPPSASLPPAPPAAEPEVEESADLPLVEQSQLGKALATHLKNVFQVMELWYLRSSIEKVSRLLILARDTR